MPVYTYRREDGSTFDVRQRFRDSALETCPTTGQLVSRVIQPAGIIFKGSGFYVNDSSKVQDAAAKNGDSAKKPEKAEATPAAKTDSKGEPKAAAKAKASAKK